MTWHSYVTWLIRMWHSPLKSIALIVFTLVVCTWIHTQHGLSICNTTHSHVTWLIHMRHDSVIRDMTHSYVMIHSNVALLIPVYLTIFILVVCTWIHIGHDSFIYWLIHMWHDSFIFDMTHSYDWFICDIRRIHIWHDSFICDTTHSYVTWLIHLQPTLFPHRSHC